MSAIPKIVEETCPHLTSPAALGIAHWGPENFHIPPHIAHVNELLQEFFFGDLDRLIINMPYQHGKSRMCSILGPAHKILIDPDTRIVLVGNEAKFAADNFGMPVKDIIEKWGPDLGVRIREDSTAKGAWMIDGREGGMVCKGPHGGVVGRAADIFVIDDLIKDTSDVLSQVVMEGHWQWFRTVVLGRMRTKSKLLVVMTRWHRRDLCGRILEFAQKTGEHWEVVKFPAIATQKDELGRKPGEPLWEEQVSLRLHKINQQENIWFPACWQQEPEAADGEHLKPHSWPQYHDLGDAWSLPDAGGRRIFHKSECTRFATVDWATSSKKRSKFTAIGDWTLTPRGDVLVMGVINKRLPLEKCVPELAALCRRIQPIAAAAESDGFQEAMANECRAYREIPEIKRLSHQGKTKLQRAYPAINMGQQGRIFLPAQGSMEKIPGEEVTGWPRQDWLEVSVKQWAAFTGVNDDYTDILDVLSYACSEAVFLRPSSVDDWPTVLVPGRGDI